MKHSKSDIITFKVDESLREALAGIPNRSEFIRAAVLAALDSVCPLCRGTGILTPHQREHWMSFAGSHTLRECDKCHEMHLVCLNRSDAEPKHPSGAKGTKSQPRRGNAGGGAKRGKQVKR